MKIKCVGLFHLVMYLFMTSTLIAAEAGPVTIGGNYLGMIQYMKQENRTRADDRRNHFDFAMNLDVNWRIADHISGIIQFQGSPGAGSLGFPGPGVEVTDLNLEYRWDEHDLSLTMGSFDMPFGNQTDDLTNNADSFRNPFLMNSLFYSAFGGVVGTLNTIGGMAAWDPGWVRITAAVTNGTDESAANPDGNFAFAVRVGKDKIFDRLTLSASYMISDDTEPSGSAGFAADFSGWMGDLKLDITDRLYLKGYGGVVSYGDHHTPTRDDVAVWMGEIFYKPGRWGIGARASGWFPDDSNGDSMGISTAVVNPGPAITRGVVVPVRDQHVIRYQGALNYDVTDNLRVKLEYFRDDYERRSLGRSTDVDGVLLLLNGRF